MDTKLYQQLAHRTECDQDKSLARMSFGPAPIRVNHAIIGMAGEVGELASLLQKWIYYGKQVDPDLFREELGDVFWYVAEICNALGFDFGNIMEANIAKLRVRYPKKYTDARAADENRDRDEEAKAVAEKKEQSAPEQKMERSVSHTWTGKRCYYCGAHSDRRSGALNCPGQDRRFFRPQIIDAIDKGILDDFPPLVEEPAPVASSAPPPAPVLTPPKPYSSADARKRSSGKRTKAEVLIARNTAVGCCNRHANNQSCNCLEEAAEGTSVADRVIERLDACATQLEQDGHGFAQPPGCESGDHSWYYSTKLKSPPQRIRVCRHCGISEVV